MRCPICKADSRPWGDVEGVPLLRCIGDECGFRFLDLTYWQSGAVDRDYYEDWSEGPVNIRAPWIRARVNLLRKFKHSGAVADLGCGIGETAIALRDSGFSVVGVEESDKATNFLKAQYPNVEWVCQNLLKFLEYNPRSFDAITMFHVLEHIPYPKDVMKLADEALIQPGIVVIEVPDVAGGVARLRGKRWDYYLNHHVNYFDLRSLQHLMSAFGFRRRLVKRTYHFSFPQGHLLKDLVKGTLAAAGLNSIIRTVWTK
jgi:2-polyprenyl-3-methyl-5-hydroxy-6-metoxy-1,4-benzoquinol methylase